MKSQILEERNSYLSKLIFCTLAFSLGHLLTFDVSQDTTKLVEMLQSVLKYKRAFDDFTELGKQKLGFWHYIGFRNRLTEIAMRNETHRSETVSLW